LPEAIALLLEKVSRIENILTEGTDRGLAVKEMLTSAEAVEFMGISRSTFYKLSFKRQLPVYKPGGKKLYVKRSDILAWQSSCRVSSQGEIEKEAVDYVSNNPLKLK